MDYLATTESHKIVYPGEKQKSTSTDGYSEKLLAIDIITTIAGEL